MMILSSDSRRLRIWAATSASCGCTPSRTCGYFFTWCRERNLAPLAVQRAQIECYVRRMQVNVVVASGRHQGAASPASAGRTLRVGTGDGV
jgi:hypothetical protein